MSSEMIGENRSGSVGSDQTSPAAPSSTNYEENSPNTKRDLETGQNRLTGGEEEQITSTMATLAIDTCPPQHQVSPSRHNEMRPEGISLTATKVELAQVLPPTYEGPSPSNQNTTAQPLASDSPHLQTPMSSVRTYQSIFSGPVTPTQSPQMAPPNYSDPPPPINPYYTSMGGQGAQIPPGTYYQPYYTPAQVYQPPPHPAVGGYTSQFSTASSSSWGSVELPAPSYHMTPPSTLPPYQGKYSIDAPLPLSVSCSFSFPPLSLPLLLLLPPPPPLSFLPLPPSLLPLSSLSLSLSLPLP